MVILARVITDAWTLARSEGMSRPCIALLTLLLLAGCSDPADPTDGAEKVVKKYESGQKKAEGYRRGNKLVGRWSWWYESGQKAREYEFKDGKPHGRHTSWYESGRKSAEYEFKDGWAHGPWTLWHKNGQKKEEGKLNKAKKEGRWTHWQEDGTLNHLASGIYKDDKKIADLPEKK